MYCYIIVISFADIRVEEMLMDKLDRKKRDHITNHELLGQTMLDAGNEFGPGTPYGKRLCILSINSFHGYSHFVKDFYFIAIQEQYVFEWGIFENSYIH